MCLFSVRPCSKPCSSNSDPPGATLPAGFLFALVGVLPCWGVLLPCCRPPSLFPCRLRGGSVLHFLFTGVISPGFIFLSSCGFPAALRAVSVSLAWVYGVPRGPLWAVTVAVGLAYPAAGAQVWELLGAVVGRSGSRHGRRRSGRALRWPSDFFSRVFPDRSARASWWVCLPAPKSLGVKSRPRQPFSRPAGLNYSRWGKSCHCFCSRKSLGLIRPFRRQL